MKTKFSRKIENACTYSEEEFSYISLNSFKSLTIYKIPTPENARGKGFGKDFFDAVERMEKAERNLKTRFKLKFNGDPKKNYDEYMKKKKEDEEKDGEK